MINPVELSKKVSYILRHTPEDHGLVLDQEGWVAMDTLLEILRNKKEEWKDINEIDLIKLTEQAEKKRHEIKHGKIRALYGHSTEEIILKDPVVPPNVLYHGAPLNVLNKILKEGLKPMKRHYVHLTTDQDVAVQVAKRKSSDLVLLTIDAENAVQEGIKFYCGNSQIWLADFISPKYIKINK